MEIFQNNIWIGLWIKLQFVLCFITMWMCLSWKWDNLNWNTWKLSLISVQLKPKSPWYSKSDMLWTRYLGLGELHFYQNLWKCYGWLQKNLECTSNNEAHYPTTQTYAEIKVQLGVVVYSFTFCIGSLQRTADFVTAFSA